MVPAHIGGINPGTLRPVEQHIAVPPPMRGMAGVELRRNRARPADGGRIRQQRIDPANPRRGLPLGQGIEVGHLPDSMHAGIGAPCPVDTNAFSGYPGERIFQIVLNRATRLLRLPTAEPAAVILDSDSEPLRCLHIDSDLLSPSQFSVGQCAIRKCRNSKSLTHMLNRRGMVHPNTNWRQQMRSNFGMFSASIIPALPGMIPSTHSLPQNRPHD